MIPRRQKGRWLILDKNISDAGAPGRGKSYLAVDLKSFYASVECVERGLDPLTTNLVVADPGRTEKTICLAVSPSLKANGVPGRPRLSEVVQKVKGINAARRSRIPGGNFTGKSYSAVSLQMDPSLELEYIVAVPRMALYIEYSTKIYQIYLKYIAPEDIHVYSIDEVFMDVTAYLGTYRLTPHGLAQKILRDIYETTGITATAGIGTNLYLCKVAMDIVAKHAPPDGTGARIASLDETGYRKLLWGHRPLTDFWRVGRGYAGKLEKYGMYTMGDIARCSLGGPLDCLNEDLLYRLFGANAELLIDHAWGWEPCTIADVKAYKPKSTSISSGQVLHEPYTAEKARLVAREMADQVSLCLVEKHLATDRIVLTIGYDRSSLTDPGRLSRYHGEISPGHYGGPVPEHARGTGHTGRKTSSARLIMGTTMDLFDRIVDKNLLVRRINITACCLIPEPAVKEQEKFRQMDLFTDYAAEAEENRTLEKEHKMQEAVLEIKKKFGKNAVLKGMSLEEGATARDRNSEIGGHKA